MNHHMANLKRNGPKNTGFCRVSGIPDKYRAIPAGTRNAADCTG